MPSKFWYVSLKKMAVMDQVKEFGEIEPTFFVIFINRGRLTDKFNIKCQKAAYPNSKL